MEAWAITSSTGSRNVSVLASLNHTRRSKKMEATWPQRSTKAPRCCCTRQVRLRHAHTRLPYRAQIRTRHKHAHTNAHKRRSIDERFRPANRRGRSRIGREASCSRLRLGGRCTMYLATQAWRRRAGAAKPVAMARHQLYVAARLPHAALGRCWLRRSGACAHRAHRCYRLTL